VQVRPIRFHDLRHTTASLLMMAGANPAAVQRILRHRDPRLTTEVYGHLAPDYLKGEVDRLSFGVTGLAEPVEQQLPLSEAGSVPLATTLLRNIATMAAPASGTKENASRSRWFKMAGAPGLEPGAFGFGVKHGAVLPLAGAPNFGSLAGRTDPN